MLDDQVRSADRQAIEEAAVGTSVTDARGNTSTTFYDALRRKYEANGPAGTGIRTVWIYDDNGDQIQTRQWDSAGAAERTTVTTYSATRKPLTVSSYSPYGEFGSGQSAPPTGSPFGYTGRQYDVETGLYQYRARYYSLRLGQFLSSDPIGTKDDPMT